MKKKNKRERGVALLITLGVLSLLLILAMAFSYSSMYFESRAQLNEDLTKSRLLCELGLERIVSMLKIELCEHEDPKNVFPAAKCLVEGTGAWNGYYFTTSVHSSMAQDGLTDALSLSVNNLNYFPTSLPDPNSSWIPIYAHKEINGNPETIIDGRFAFIAVDETGKLDPNTIVSDTIAEGNEVRDGYSMSDLSLENAGFSSAFAENMRSETVGGLRPASNNWFSRYHIVKKHGITTQADLDDIIASLFTYRRADTLDDISALYDISQIGTDYVDDLLAEISWLDNWPDSHKETFQVGTHRGKQIAANIIDYSDADNNATTDADYDYHSSNKVVICQVPPGNPANEYTISVGRTAVPAHLAFGCYLGPCDGAGNAYTVNKLPEYVGLEKVPYVNEAQLTIINNTIMYPHNGKILTDISMYCTIELVNLYGNINLGSDCMICIEAKIRGKMGAEGALDTINFFDTYTGVIPDFNSSGYKTTFQLPMLVNDNTFLGSKGDPDALKLYNMEIDLRKVWVYDDSTGELWDLVCPETTGVNGGTINSGTQWYVYCEVDDPRQNTFPNDWSWSSFGLAPDVHLGTKNSNCTPNPGTGYDNNPGASQPWHVDSVYIKNSPIVDALELSVIHRGEKWQTLNLVDYKYNPDTDTEIPGDFSDDADGDVDDRLGDFDATEGNGGDRNILNFIKVGTMHDDEESLIGRVNINTRRKNVLEALFKSIEKESTDSCPGTGGTTINTSNLDTFIDDIMATTRVLPFEIDAVSQNNRNPYKYGLLFQNSSFSNREIETLMMRTKNLVTAKHNYFTVIVCAQTIKDVGGVDADINIRGVDCQLGRYDEGGDKITAEQKIRAVLHRNAGTNNITVEHYEYLEY
ncbi:MAG: hypothetical protein U9O87_01540 [Verrucomicrobiota bacterium]|nr:hypothetical protein [Verrucomicrobiota bacterium]